MRRNQDYSETNVEEKRASVELITPGELHEDEMFNFNCSSLHRLCENHLADTGIGREIKCHFKEQVLQYFPQA